MNKSIIAAVLAAGLLTACAVTPVAVVQPVRPVAVQSEYIPPQDYVVGAPLYYESAPGVAFYPMFISTPGSCFCVVPMRFYNGVWLGVDGVVLHRGHFQFVPAARIESRHLETWRHSEAVFHGMRPMHGSFQVVGGHARPLPPPGSMHHQAIAERRVNHDPAAAKYPAQNRHAPAIDRPPAAQPGHERSDRMQKPADATPQKPQQNSAVPARPQQQGKQTPPASPEKQAKPQQAKPQQAPQQGRAQAKPQQDKPQQAPQQAKAPANAQADKAPPKQREKSGCSDQDRKDNKCK